MTPASIVLLAALVAFAPPVGYIVWIRNLERRGREPWAQVIKLFLWGVGAFLVALVAEKSLENALGPSFAESAGAAVLFTVVLVPLIEEPSKAFGLPLVKDDQPEAEDGLIYGAAAGLGFSAIETVAFVATAYSGGGLAGLFLVGLVRSFSAALMHATATAMVGYGFLRPHPLPLMRRFGFLGLAVLLHAGYNGSLLVDRVVPALRAQLWSALFGLVAAVTLAIATFSFVRRRILQLDRAAPSSSAGDTAGP